MEDDVYYVKKKHCLAANVVTKLLFFAHATKIIPSFFLQIVYFSYYHHYFAPSRHLHRISNGNAIAKLQCPEQQIHLFHGTCIHQKFTKAFSLQHVAQFQSVNRQFTQSSPTTCYIYNVTFLQHNTHQHQPW